jgi:glycosyltransferase involved in cell wall biosynthesis
VTTETNNNNNTARREDQPRQATVLQVLPALGAQGGVERGTVEIARAIVEGGGRAIVASAGGPLEHRLKRVGAEHVTLPVDSKNPFAMYANIGRLADVIRRENVDIVHAVHARSRAPAWSAFYAAKRTGAHFITTFHGTYGAGSLLKRAYNAVMTKGERVIAISAFIAGHIRKVYGTPPSHIRTIHRGVDVDAFDPAKVSAEREIKLATAWRLDEGLPVVMLPGRLTRWKGQLVFLEAIARLGRTDIRAVLVGSDQGRTEYREELERKIQALDLGAVVRLVDHCDDMPAAYMLSDVVVSASLEPEAFGRVVVEGQAMGRPVVASDHGGAKETVLAGETGWLVAPGDAAALADAIGRVLAMSANDRAKLAVKAVAHVRENFSTRAMCAKTLEVYEEVLDLAPRRR